MGYPVILQVCDLLLKAYLSVLLEMADILLIRMTSDFTRPPEKRYNYRNALSGLVSLIKEEGIRGLGRGLGTNTVHHSRITLALIFTFFTQTRAVLMNVRPFHATLSDN